jgi:fumarate reductase flavoprotein subunit
VERLYYDEKLEKVVGVAVKSKGKKSNVKANTAVILATGGFSGNVRKLDNWIPAYAGTGVVIGGSGSDGEGIMMSVRDVGTPTTHMQYSATYPMGIESGKRSGPMARYYFWTPRGAIIVNQEGKRYIDELTPATKMTLELAKQPGKVHYVVLDSEMWEGALKQYDAGVLFCLPSLSMDRVNEELKKEKVLFKADNLEAVAKKAKIDPKNLAETVSKYNQFVDDKKDAEFGRKTLPAKLQKGPYYLVKMTFWTCLTLGGIRANDKLQVLDSSDNVVKGLYAAGEAVGGVHGDTYLFGCAFGWAHTSGWVAGKNAAKG